MLGGVCACKTQFRALEVRGRGGYVCAAARLALIMPLMRTCGLKVGYIPLQESIKLRIEVIEKE